MELSAELSKSENCLSAKRKSIDQPDSAREELTPPPVPPLPVNYQLQRSDGMFTNPIVYYNTYPKNAVNSFSVFTLFHLQYQQMKATYRTTIANKRNCVRITKPHAKPN